MQASLPSGGAAQAPSGPTVAAEAGSLRLALAGMGVLLGAPSSLAMRRRFGLALGFCAVMLAAATARAEARVELVVSAPRVSVGDSLTVEVVASGDYDGFGPPTSDGFDFENAGRSSRVSIVNGHVERSESLTFSAMPRRPGRWLIRGPQLLADGRVVARAEDVTVEVVDARDALGPAVTPEEASDLRQYVGQAFFVRPELMVRQPYIGQPFVIAWDLYVARNQNVARLGLIGEPNYGELTVEELQRGQQVEPEMVRFGGSPFARHRVAKVLLTSHKAGDAEILGPNFRIDVSNFMNARAHRAGARPMKITVRPLPTEGRPASFQPGAVGQFAWSGWLLERGRRVQSLKAMTGERVVVGYEASGRGNLHGLQKVAPPTLSGMQVEELPDDHGQAISFDASGPHGKRTWQYTLSFERPGVYALPERKFAAFDPEREAYVEAAVMAMTIRVEGPNLAPSGLPSPEPAQGPPGVAGEPAAAPTAAAPGTKGAPAGAADAPRLRPLAAVLGRPPGPDEAAAESPWLWPLGLSPWLLMALAWLAQRLRQRLRASDAGASALSEALTALQASAGTGGQGDGFARQRAAVDAYLAQRAAIRASGQTFVAIRAALRAQGAADVDVDALIVALEHCDFARFAPVGDRDADLQRSAAELERCLRALDVRLAPTTASPPRGGHGAAALVLPLCLALGAALAVQDACAAGVDAEFEAANRALLAGDPAAAEAGYRGLLRVGQGSAALHYNLGNALTPQGKLGAATGHYRAALRAEPAPELREDIEANLALVRDRLAEASRRRHRILHVFDESAELEVVLARAAPRAALRAVVALAGFLAVGAWLWGRRRSGAARLWRTGAAVALGLTQLLAGGWLLHAQQTLQATRSAIVARADAPLEACVGVSEPVELPEGLEVRWMGERADGRIEVRLPNGRLGCVDPSALYTIEDG